jgi:ribonuclease HI
MVILWVPVHFSIGGNERSDALTKEGAKKTQEDISAIYDEANTVIKAHQKAKWQLQH